MTRARRPARNSLSLAFPFSGRQINQQCAKQRMHSANSPSPSTFLSPLLIPFFLVPYAAFGDASALLSTRASRTLRSRCLRYIKISRTSLLKRSGHARELFVTSWQRGYETRPDPPYRPHLPALYRPRVTLAQFAFPTPRFNWLRLACARCGGKLHLSASSRIRLAG